MNKQMFRDYIDCFNRDDFAGFSRYYADDVVLELPKQELRGRQAIIDFYRVVKARIRETLQINEIVADDEGLAAEVETEFYAREDWPDFIGELIRDPGLASAIQLSPARGQRSVTRREPDEFENRAASVWA